MGKANFYLTHPVLKFVSGKTAIDHADNCWSDEHKCNTVSKILKEYGVLEFQKQN